MSSEHDRDAERKRNKRREDRLVIIPPCDDKARRQRLEADDEAWLLWYFGECDGCSDPFWYEFVPQQKDMIAAIRQAIQFAGDQSIAASRGEGKTTLAERLLLKYTLQGVVSYSVLFAASGTMADNSLDAIKTAIAENERLAADYPEVCYPVRALEGAPQRANAQVVNGFRHDTNEPFEMARSQFTWCGQELIFPNVPGSPSAGAIIATRGLDAAVRGLKKRGKRPQLAIIDDPDTEDTARSEEQAKKLEARIDKAIGGLGGQQRGIGRVMLTTLQSRIAVSYRYTDTKQKPTWKGRRYRFLVKHPNRMDLWEEYIQLVHVNMQDGDEFARGAFEFYAEHREQMDAGAEVANPNRYDSQPLPDGTPKELSALQRYFNEVARLGQEAVSTEYDNDPPEEAGPIESGISSNRVQRQLSGFARYVVPPGCVVVTQGMDCKKAGIHWVVRAWQPDGTGYTIDYGFFETHGSIRVRQEDEDRESRIANDTAIREAILGRLEQCKATEYVNENGERFPVELTLIDGRYRQSAVYSACHEAGLGVYPVLGFGKSAGCWRPIFTPYSKRTQTAIPGENWNLIREGNLWICHANADHWKAWEHDRWMTDPGEPGCMYLFGVGSGQKRMSFDETGHHSYSRHVVAEVEVEEMVKGVLKRGFKPKPGHSANHYLDASYYSSVAANMKGVRLLSTHAKPVTLPGAKPTQRRTLAEMASGR